MGDAAHLILTQDAKTFTGHFCIDDTLLYEHGVKDFEKYRVDRKRGAGAGLLRAGQHPAAAWRDDRRTDALDLSSRGMSPGCRSNRLLRCSLDRWIPGNKCRDDKA